MTDTSADRAGARSGAVCLAVGFGAGYWANSQMVETATPIVISRVTGPVDANGMTLGRRLAPLERTLPITIALPRLVDANGAPLGRRVPPFETLSPSELTVRAATDTNGLNLGRRVAPFEDTAATAAQVAEADTVAFGRQGGRP